MLLALGARLFLIDQESYWFDEIWAVKQVRLSLPDLLASLAEEDVHPPLYPVLLWGWVRFLGEAEWATRLLSALAGTGAVALVWALGRDLYDRATARVAALILAVHAYAVDFSQESRAYSVMLFLALLAVWTLVRWCRGSDSRRWAVAWIGSAVLLAWVHVYGSFVLLGLGLWVLGWQPHMRRRFLLSAAVVAFAFAPWVPVLLSQVGRVQEGFWIAPIDLTDPVRWVWHWGGYSIPAAVVLTLLVLRGLMDKSPGRPLLALWIAVPVGLPVALSLLGEPIFHPKYPIAILGAFALLAARAVLSFEGSRRRAVGAVLAVTLLVGLIGKIYLRTSKEQYRELAALAAAEAADGVTVIAEASARPYVTFYLKDTPVQWLGDDPPEVAGDEVLYLLVHPKTSEREARLSARWTLLEEITLVEARALRYRVSAP